MPWEFRRDITGPPGKEGTDGVAADPNRYYKLFAHDEIDSGVSLPKLISIAGTEYSVGVEKGMRIRATHTSQVITPPPQKTLTTFVGATQDEVLVGTSVTFTSTVGGTATGPISRQWQRATSASGPFTNVGTGASTYSVSRSTAGTYYVRCVVTRDGLTATSNVDSVTWMSRPVSTSFFDRMELTRGGGIGSISENIFVEAFLESGFLYADFTATATKTAGPTLNDSGGAMFLVSGTFARTFSPAGGLFAGAELPHGTYSFSVTVTRKSDSRTETKSASITIT